jgi:hypothetical protein
VRFEILGDLEGFYLCHCKHCQKDTGSAHAANLFSSSAQLVWRSGQDAVTCYQLPSTQHIKSFCSRCGSALPSLQMNDALVVVPAGSVDQELAVTPNAHIFTASRAAWDRDLETIPSYEQLPGQAD